MKIRLISAVIMMMAFVACTQEETLNNSFGLKELNVDVEGLHASSRVGFTEGDAEFFWTNGDKIGVTTTTSSTFQGMTLQGDGGSATGKFTGSMSGAPSGYAVYPYGSMGTHKVSGDILTYKLPASYKYNQLNATYAKADGNSFNAPMWGQITNGSASFKHLGGVIVFEINELPENTSGEFILMADNKINGTFTATLTDSEPVIETENTDVEAEKKVTISFATAVGQTKGYFYVPVPTGSLGNLMLAIVDADENEIASGAWDNITIARKDIRRARIGEQSIIGGGIVNANNVAAANVALSNEDITSVKIKEVVAADVIIVPAKNTSDIASAPHTIDLSEAALPNDGVVTIKVTEGSAGSKTVEQLTVVVPEGTEATGKLNINAPGTTVTIQAANGTIIDVIEAITAENTLIIEEGVTVNTLKILGGNVKFNGTVNKILDADDNEYTLVKTAEQLTAAIDGDKTHIILGADIQSSEIITIDKPLTLNGNGYTLTSTAARAINVETTGTVTINNLNIVAGERAINIINEASTVNLNNVTATANNNAVMIATSAGAVKLTVDKCDFTGLAVVNVAGAGAQVTIADTKITNVDATDKENYGAITVWSSAEGASVAVTGGEIVVADDSKQAWIFPADATITGVDDIGYIVATVGDAGFDTLDKAIEDAKAGGTIELVRDITASDIITINKAVTINGNGKSLTSTAARAINVETTGTVTINNLNIVAGERAINIINEASTVNLNNVTATANNNAVMIATSAGAVKLTVDKCDFTGLAVVNVAGAGAQVTIADTKITNVDATDKENYGAITVWSSAEGASVAVTGGEIIVADDSKKAYVFPADATVTGVDDIGYIVALDGDAGYDTLKEAVEKAEAGATIELVRNVEASEIITINKSLVLNGNGYTLTSTAERAINVSGANGVTIKNLTINASGERAINIIQNATNVTIDHVTATAANYTVNVASSASEAKVDIKNSKLTGLCTVNVSAASADVKVDSSTIYCNDHNTTVGESYSALSLNKEAVNGKITATNTTINVVDGSDSFKGRNGAENGEVTINGSTAGVVVMVAYITYPGSDYYHAFATLAKAVEFAKEGDVISLLRDIEISETIVVEKAVTIDLNDKTVTANCKKAFEVYADVTIENGTIISQQRCVDTRTNVNLTLTDVTLKADTYYSAYGNQQPLTIGGSTNGTKVSMTNVTIDAGYQGYAIISFVKTELTATNSNLNGYAALYVREGSDESKFNFNGSTLSGTTGSNDVAGNSFATIAIEANSVKVTLDANSNLNSIGNHHTEFYIKEGTGSTVTGPNVE